MYIGKTCEIKTFQTKCIKIIVYKIEQLIIRKLFIRTLMVYLYEDTHLRLKALTKH